MPAGNLAQIEVYLAAVPEPARSTLKKLRAQICLAAPKATEGFGYGLPGFYQDRPLFYYGAAKAHCALYGTIPSGFDNALAGFVRSKGALRFTPERPLPAALVKRLVKAKLAENQAVQALRDTKKEKPKAKR